MLRPEQMSKISMAGTRAVMRDVIEAVHEMHVVHFSDYDGAIDGFETGSPLSGADAAAEKLVTVRSFESILDVTEEDAGPTRIVSLDDIEEELGTIRSEVNDLDDRRSAVEDELRELEERIDAAEPFVDLGYDLELLSGYDSIEVAVGEGDAEAVTDALQSRDDVAAFDVETSGDVVAVFVYPNDGDGALADALVGVEFEQFPIPDASGDPESYVAELAHERDQLESRLDRIEDELEEYRLEHAAFLLAAEERLTIEVQKTEIPLQFATTDHTFVAEGWIPTEEFAVLEETVREAADDHVELEELEVADYRAYANGHVHAPADEQEAVADGGETFEEDDEPPVIQDNPSWAEPFEILIKMINRPKYSEFDPTMIVLLTFPVFFGFMIGDVGYGLLYVAMGWLLVTRVDNDALRSLGGIGVWSGAFTVLFGVLYGEIFGMHVLGTILWGSAADASGLIMNLGHPPMHKGLQPHYLKYARAWLLVTLFVGLAHVTTGYALSFLKDLRHGVMDAVTESGSWAMLMVGLWAWIFSKHAKSTKPAFMYTVFDGTQGTKGVAYALGFPGLPKIVGVAGLAIAALGLALLLYGEGIVGALESLNVLVNVLSYTRIAAVLLAKAGMAFVVNLLVFGAVSDHGTFHFLIGGASHGAEPLFPGLFHMGPVGVLGGLIVLVLGHLVVLALGITSAGLQAVRLEYVEFFGKFYDGGGAKYDPFGYQRIHTTED
ncbi:MAG: V-type ATP synthase subunit I [Halanaeroarchaeum sp.]